ncbi:MAG: DUF4838 domain-containing protein [Treponema sp.]|jgi:hypothetical protein|nr:DUF4838 domain-containing protein [Treponema sp.]
MANFDVSKVWVILIPAKQPTAAKMAEELSHYIELLRCQAKLPQTSPRVQDTSETPPDDSVPIILLNVDMERQEGNGFSWRMGKDRIEIYGESGRGLCNGVFDFLGALGFRWPRPGQELLPPLDKLQPNEYIPKEVDAYHPSEADSICRRMVFGRKDSSKTLESMIVWAVRNKIDTLVFSLRSRVLQDHSPRPGDPPITRFFARLFGKPNHDREIVLRLAEKYKLAIEGGGWDLSLLVPRGYFFLNQEIFRMNSGKRIKQYNFCPTAPQTIRLLQKEAEKIFRANPKVAVYHLWPDRGHEQTWCSCPTCRAFTLVEQNRIAVNAVADTLAKVNPGARISYYENISDQGDVAPRHNIFKINHLPGETGVEAMGWFLEENIGQPTPQA